MIRLITIIYFLLFYSICFSQLNTETLMQFKYKDIPFGKTESEITELLSNDATIETPESIDIQDFYNFTGIQSYFIKGTFGYSGDGSLFLKTSVSEKIVTKYNRWDKIKKNELYFTKPNDSDVDPTLFLVHKEMAVEYSDLKSVFSILNNAVTKQLGKTPKILNSSFIFPSGAEVPAKIAIWDNNTELVFLLVKDNGILRYVDFLYRSKTGWNKYLKSTESFNKKTDKKIKKTTDEF